MLKNKILGLGCTLASIFFITSPALEAFHPVSDVSLTTGWRRDEIKTSTDFGFGHTDFKLKGLDTWEFGIRGQYAFTGFCGCEESWLDDLYIKGSAVWGWGQNGKFHFGNNDSYSSDSYSGFDSFDYRGAFDSIHAHKTRTYDYDIGLGWLYAIDCNWGIGPTVGYAWNRLTTHPKNRGSSSDSYSYSDSFDYSDSYSGNDRAGYSTKWHGPWLGLELAYEDCSWHFDLGYEFHWAKSKSKYGNFGGSNSHKSRYGNVLYADAWYDLCDGWEIGLGFKYRSFQSGHKHHNRSGSYSSYSDSEFFASDYSYSSGGFGSSRTKWDSWGFTLDLGYRF
jgi:hypothetical protein